MLAYGSMDHHTLAAVSITGSCLDVLGSLYLAYDLLGGQHGPLRLITRTVTYSVVFGIGYGLGLGLWFGVASGIATGITLAIEFNRAARGLDHHSLPWEGLFAAIRGVGIGAGLYRIVGLRFAIAFALLIAVGQTFDTPAVCVLPSIMSQLAVLALRAVSFGELWSAPSDTSPVPLSAALLFTTWTTPGRLRFA